ncbi:hypothetical protein [Streptomyces olivochromogenes]|uniref:hypothetical protein n=1 Tax=Streptomyces olivochromogenes TaxID=1963 RepID=UPI001F3C5E9F|nr:hypothetical protein [Streptomyces olivochromogenes]MCF3131143.1 hypothetical protein [Streptomyces olivochromogenes]
MTPVDPLRPPSWAIGQVRDRLQFLAEFRSDWPHVEVSRFHRALSVFVSSVAIALVAAETVRHHRPAEITILAAVLLPHCAIATLLVRRMGRSPHGGEHRG